MTRTDSEVQRCTRGSYNVLFPGALNARPCVVRIGAGDVLEFRELGRRARFAIPIDSAFRYAVRCTAFKERMEKARENPRQRKGKGARR